MIFSEETMRKLLAESIQEGSSDMQTDNSGQIIVYANMFRWKDGTIRDEPDPTYDDGEN